MTTYGYARISTDLQTTDLQLDALRRAGATEVVSDESSGSLPASERPGLSSLLARLSRGDTLVVYSLSRLGRSAVDVLSTMRLLDERGVRFRSTSEAIDTATPMGRLLLTVLAGVAQFEREVIVERVRDGMAAARARGTHIGRPREYSEEQLAALRAGVAGGLTVPQAAERAEMTYRQARRALAGDRAKKVA